MLVVTSVAGNVFCDGAPDSGDMERVRLSRTDLEKCRIRAVTDGGTEVGLSLKPGVLRHGDILTGDGDGRSVVVEQAPEKVIVIRPAGGWDDGLLVMLGHAIGNRHRPLSTDGESVTFPIQADSEVGVFEALFARFAGRIKISAEERIFFPSDGADVHDHR